MASYESTFHIDNPGPRELYEYLDTIEARSPDSNDELREAAADLGHRIGTLEKISAGPVLGRLGVVDPENQFSYTDMGDALVDVMYSDRDLFDNLLHFLYYTAYDRYPEEHIYSSYSYQKFTQYLFANEPFQSIRGEKGTIVGEISTQAETDEEIDLGKTRKGVSLSNKSLNNYLQYIRDLNPSVNPADPDETPGFELRSFCPPGLVLIAIDYLYSQENSDYNDLIRLSDELKTNLRQICMLSEEGLTEALEYTESAYSGFSVTHDFGLNVRLEEKVGVDDLE